MKNNRQIQPRLLQDESRISLETFAPIKALHRGEGSYISFGRKDDNGKWQDLASLTIAEIEANLPALAQWLVKDAYFTVNSMYRAAPYTNRVTGLPGVWRRQEHTRYLNACYVDLDCGRKKGSAAQRLSWRDAAAHLGNLMDEGIIPQCSIFAHSGRGLYVFWILRDEIYSEDQEHQPPRCWPETVALYKAINKAIAARLANLAADPNAIDVSRVLRVPGTIHSSTKQKPAKYMIQADADGHHYSYTLRQLAGFFGVPYALSSLPSMVRNMASDMTYGIHWTEDVEARSEMETEQLAASSVPYYGRETKEQGSAPKRAKGRRVLYANRAQDLVILESYRGGWRKGTRLRYLRLYGEFLRGADATQDDALEALRTMASNCKPAYPSEPNDTPLSALIGDVFSGILKSYKNETLCRWLGITPELARELELSTIVPLEVQNERKSPLGGARQQIAEERREAIQELIGQHSVKSSRELAKMLQKRGYEVTHTTVNNDLKALGYDAAQPERRSGRPSLAQQG